MSFLIEQRSQNMVQVGKVQNMGQPWSFCLFSSFSQQNEKYSTKFDFKAFMVCFGFKPWTSKWQVQTNPLSYGGPTRQVELKAPISPPCGQEKSFLSGWQQISTIMEGIRVGLNDQLDPKCLSLFKIPPLFSFTLQLML